MANIIADGSLICPYVFQVALLHVHVTSFIVFVSDPWTHSGWRGEHQGC